MLYEVGIIFLMGPGKWVNGICLGERSLESCMWVLCKLNPCVVHCYPSGFVTVFKRILDVPSWWWREAGLQTQSLLLHLSTRALLLCFSSKLELKGSVGQCKSMAWFTSYVPICLPSHLLVSCAPITFVISAYCSSFQWSLLLPIFRGSLESFCHRPSHSYFPG